MKKKERARESACKTLRVSVSLQKVFKEKLCPDRNVSFVKIDGAVRQRVHSLRVSPAVVALYPLCQLEVGYWRIDTGTGPDFSVP